MKRYTKDLLKARTVRAIQQKTARFRRHFGLDRPASASLRVLDRADALSTIDKECRSAAEDKVQQILEAEADEHLDRERYEHKLKTEHLGYRNGHAPKRTIATRCGPVTIRPPKFRQLKQPFVSNLLAKRQQQTSGLNDFLPDLYLAGLSLGDFDLFLREFLGEGANLSTSHIARLKARWQVEYRIWAKRPLRKAYAYVWADGIYLRVGGSNDRLAVLVVLGVNEDGTKELLAVEPGYRESDANWQAVFAGLRARGVERIRLVIGDGCQSLWNAVAAYYWEAAQQLCWCHKIRNVLANLPDRLQIEARADLRDIYRATSRAAATETIIRFAEKYQAYGPAVERLLRDQDRLLTFFDFPKDHWKSILTTNPIESIFAPVRTRLNKAKRIRSTYAALALVQQLLQVRMPRLVKINSARQVAYVLAGEQYRDGATIDHRTSKSTRKNRCA